METDGAIVLKQGDCLDKLREIDDGSVDSVVTDPPYGLSFMGKAWDKNVPSEEVWRECLRVLKPGGHLLAFAGTRTQHRMAVAIEDAGFEIRDMIAWVYGSGFPKSHDVSKAIDKAAGAEREVVCPNPWNHVRNHSPEKWDSATRTQDGGFGRGASGKSDITAPATPAAQQWRGWGTALKPALEPITVARKPFKGTVAANVLKHGTGAVNIDGCRVGSEEVQINTYADRHAFGNSQVGKDYKSKMTSGRWPANLIHDGSEEPVDLLGDASRFFYCPKASKRDRDEGLDTFKFGKVGHGNLGNSKGFERFDTQGRNNHPTVKPTDLMRYLVRLVTQPGGTVLDPFMGSGSTGKAAALESFNFIGIEVDPEYLSIAEARINSVRDGS